MLEHNELYFDDKERKDTQTSVTDKSKSDQQQIEWIQEKKKRMLKRELAMDKQMIEISQYTAV